MVFMIKCQITAVIDSNTDSKVILYGFNFVMVFFNTSCGITLYAGRKHIIPQFQRPGLDVFKSPGAFGMRLYNMAF